MLNKYVFCFILNTNSFIHFQNLLILSRNLLFLGNISIYLPVAIMKRAFY